MAKSFVCKDKHFSARLTASALARVLSRLVCCFLAVTIAYAVSACSSNGVQPTAYTGSDVVSTIELPDTPIAAYDQADMSGYEGLAAAGLSGTNVFRNVDVLDVEREMEAGTSFVLYCGFSNCPWCNNLIAPLTRLAVERNEAIAYIDTRAKPEWNSNIDIDNYDTFVKLFGEYLEPDDDGIPHLYVPTLFFIKNGEVASMHTGTVPSQEDPHVALDNKQLAELNSALENGFAAIA